MIADKGLNISKEIKTHLSDTESGPQLVEH